MEKYDFLKVVRSIRKFHNGQLAIYDNGAEVDVGDALAEFDKELSVLYKECAKSSEQLVRYIDRRLGPNLPVADRKVEAWSSAGGGNQGQVLTSVPGQSPNWVTPAGYAGGPGYYLPIKVF